jgi:hypothetical protein
MHFHRAFEAAPQAFHLKCPPTNPETLLRKTFIDKNSFFVTGREHEGQLHKRKRIPIEAWFGHLL